MIATTEPVKPAPTSVVCQKCKTETGITPESILMNDLNGDIHCPSCNEVVFSCMPKIKTYSYVASTPASYAGYGGYGDYD